MAPKHRKKWTVRKTAQAKVVITVAELTDLLRNVLDHKDNEYWEAKADWQKQLDRMEREIAALKTKADK